MEFCSAQSACSIASMAPRMRCGQMLNAIMLETLHLRRKPPEGFSGTTTSRVSPVSHEKCRSHVVPKGPLSQESVAYGARSGCSWLQSYGRMYRSNRSHRDVPLELGLRVYGKSLSLSLSLALSLPLSLSRSPSLCFLALARSLAGIVLLPYVHMYCSFGWPASP